ncbi:hypothetical protein IE53DRAFT_257246 [Violaceomyces palustris]|uniref:Uncharacterized protein n=1 Tax=Violaceomyces palustris TaxID=1673888 RepID=A0ACD0NN85_9BASI|nr:hypothetical protein IE53DRAFT_257246 [Violaceomyces palustris]
MEERERWERERERERERHLQGSSGLGGERALTPPGHYSNSVPTPSGRASPRQHRRPDLPPQGRGYPEERDRDVELAPQHHKPNGGRAPSPDDRDRDRAYSQRSPGVGPRSVPSLASNFGRPSVLAGGPEGNGYDHGGGDRGGPGPMADRGGQVPGGLARRRGDAAQAKASRLHIDTGSGSSASFDGPPQGTLMVPSRSMGGIAKSAPAHKLTFGSESREIPSSQFELGRREDPVMRQGGGGPSQPSHQPGNFQSSSNHPNHPAATGSHRAHAGSGRVGEQVGHYTRREDGSREFTSPSQGGPIRNHPSAEMPHTANPISRHQQAYAQQQQQPPMSSRSYVPQTATLPSPAYHTTQFMRTGAPPMPADRERPGSIHGGERTLPPRTAGLNPPPTARLPDHLRSPPSSKTQFLALFSNFYDSLADSRTLKATLEDQIKRSNTLLQTLQRSSRVLEETVDRRLREERIIWEGRVRGLEGRVRELEAKLGGGGGGGAGGGGANVDGAADEGNESRSRESSGGETGSRRRGSGDSDALSKAESSFGKDRAGSTEETKRKVVEKSKETGSRREEQDRDAREEMEQDEEEDVKSSDH